MIKTKHDNKSDYQSHDKLYINNKMYTVDEVSSSENHLRFLQWNVQGINTELNESDLVHYVSSYDIVLLTETWTSKSTNLNKGGYISFQMSSFKV